MQHTIIEGESLQDIVNWMRVLINQFSGVWADNNYGTSTTLRIQSKAPSWTFPGRVCGHRIAVLPGVVNEPFAITAGVNDALLFTFDGDGGPQVSVTLSAGAARTGAEVAAAIRGSVRSGWRSGDRAGGELRPTVDRVHAPDQGRGQPPAPRSASTRTRGRPRP